MKRPLPPSDLPYYTPAFAPDQDGLGEWAFNTFINEDGPLCNEDHAHLRSAVIGWLWTSAPASNKGRTILGEAKMITPPQEKWGKAMSDYQIRQWFGRVPDFLITISAFHATEMDDASFCALVEHELMHCGQALDAFGSPRYRRDGSSIFALRPHDVEEFVGIVARYGARASGVEAMVAAAMQKPTVGLAEIAGACGTCKLRLVA